MLHDAGERVARLRHVLLARLANPADFLHEQPLVMHSVVALLLGEVRLGRLLLAGDLVAFLGDRLAHLERIRDLAGVLTPDRNRARRRALPLALAADELGKGRVVGGRALVENVWVALRSLGP